MLLPWVPAVEQLVLSLVLMWELCMSSVLSLMSQCYYMDVTVGVASLWMPAHFQEEESFIHD